jgi:hypothetical protein
LVSGAKGGDSRTRARRQRFHQPALSSPRWMRWNAARSARSPRTAPRSNIQSSKRVFGLAKVRFCPSATPQIGRIVPSTPRSERQISRVCLYSSGERDCRPDLIENGLVQTLPRSVRRRGYDDARKSTMSLFASLDIATGTIIDKCCPRQRADDFRKDVMKNQILTKLELYYHENLARRRTLPTGLHSVSTGISACSCLQSTVSTRLSGFSLHRQLSISRNATSAIASRHSRYRSL